MYRVVCVVVGDMMLFIYAVFVYGVGVVGAMMLFRYPGVCMLVLVIYCCLYIGVWWCWCWCCVAVYISRVVDVVVVVGDIMLFIYVVC